MGGGVPRKAPGTPSHRLEYEKRVNRVIDYIRDHIAADLSLDQLARVAAFSPFHFHRIFKAVVGETLASFIQRTRLERAAVALLHRPDDGVLVIALDHGFSAADVFARAFKARFGMSATEWRRKQSQAKGKQRKAPARLREHRRAMNENVTVRTFPAYHVAYMRHVGPYGAGGIPALWNRFREWMAPRGLLGPDYIGLGIGRDDATVTPPEKCRYDACVVVPGDFVPDKHVNVTDIPGGRYAVREFVGTAHEIEAAWESLYRDWLPGSGYQPEDRPCIEVYRGRVEVKGRPGAFRCELCVPVRPL